MAYIGRQQESGTYIKLDDITSQFNGVKTTFNLTLGTRPYFCTNPYSIMVSIDGVVQEAVAAYTIVEDQITFAAALPSGTDFFAIVLSTTSTTYNMTSLSIARRSAPAYTMDLHGEALGILLRDGVTKTPVHFNAS